MQLVVLNISKLQKTRKKDMTCKFSKIKILCSVLHLLTNIKKKGILRIVHKRWSEYENCRNGKKLVWWQQC